MWIKTIPKPSKGSHNELGSYIYHHPKNKRQKNTKKNPLLKLTSHTHTHTHTKKEREKLNEFTEEHIEVKQLIEKKKKRRN